MQIRVGTLSSTDMPVQAETSYESSRASGCYEYLTSFIAGLLAVLDNMIYT